MRLIRKSKRYLPNKLDLDGKHLPMTNWERELWF